MSKHLHNVIIIMAIIIMAFATTSAKKFKISSFEWDEINDTDWNIVEDSAKNIFDAAMIFEKVVDDEAQLYKQRCYRTIYHRIRILNEAGRKWGDVEIPFYSTDQKIENIQGRTLLSDGTIIELEEQHVFEKESIRSKKIKFNQITFSMPGVTDDCIIEYMIKYRSEFHINHWMIQKEIALIKGEYRWKFYAGAKGSEFAQAMVHYNMGTPNFLWLNCGPEKSVKHLPNLKETKEMLFEISNVPPFEEEPHMVPGSSLKAKLVCYYGSNDSPAAYWGDKSTTINDNALSFCERDKKIKKITQSFEQLETDKEKIIAAYNWITDNILNTAYDDLLDKKGKKQEPKENESINQIIKRGYGDRTDINRLLFDMLREMNIDAKMSYCLDRSEDIFVYESKYWQFDASLVAVPSGDKIYDYYIPSYKFMTPGSLPWFYEGVLVLLGGGNDNFATIPFSSASSNSINRVYNLNLSSDFEISGSIAMNLYGQNARRIRIYLEDNDSTEYETLLHDKYIDQYNSAEIKSFQMENYNNIDEMLKLKCKIEYPDLTAQGNRILLKPFDYLRNSDSPFFAQERKKSILFKYGHQSRESAQIELPEGWVVEALPNDTIFANIAGECGVQFNNFGNILNVQSYFILQSPFWTADQYSIIKNLFQTREDLSDLIIVLKKQD
ncbi:MAG: DUF3857 domain-containing protein [candidate division Zixibacteria bacterium]|nr:DUF3857 domain-containing protein [candidate division Zixibacteria bacterium]